MNQERELLAFSAHGHMWAIGEDKSLPISSGWYMMRIRVSKI